MRFLITAGPTREYLDSVRFISNGSSGKMGFACAAAARRRGHQVTLVAGPVDLTCPSGVKLIRVVSSEEMAQAVQHVFASCDCVIMTAAVCDYKPAKPAKYKIPKIRRKVTFALERTTDILAGLGREKRDQILIGFALQDRAGRRNAQRKMQLKNLDAVILNSPASLGADRCDAQLLTARDNHWQSHPNISKSNLAALIIKTAEKLSQPNHDDR